MTTKPTMPGALRCLTFLMILLPVFLGSQDLPPGGNPMLDGPSLLNWKPGDPRVTASKGEGESMVLAIDPGESRVQPWDIQASLATTGPVAKGDSLLLIVEARTLKVRNEMGEGAFGLVVETKPGYRKFYDEKKAAGPGWKTLLLPFPALEDAEAGKLQVCLRLGYGQQTLAFRNLRLVNYGKTVPLDRLPRSRVTWEGREPNAPWRKVAEERIDRLRKADLNLVLRDARGAPLAGIPVTVKLRRHDFTFGTTASPKWILDPGPDGDAYRNFLVSNYNLVAPDGLKWGAWEKPEKRTDTVKALDWLKVQGFDLKGHCLV